MGPLTHTPVCVYIHTFTTYKYVSDSNTYVHTYNNMRNFTHFVHIPVYIPQSESRGVDKIGAGDVAGMDTTNYDNSWRS